MNHGESLVKRRAGRISLIFRSLRTLPSFRCSLLTRSWRISGRFKPRKVPRVARFSRGGQAMVGRMARMSLQYPSVGECSTRLREGQSKRLGFCRGRCTSSAETAVRLRPVSLATYIAASDRRSSVLLHRSVDCSELACRFKEATPMEQV
jgi:hypothetical protein